MSTLWPKYENWSKLGKQNRVYRYTLNVYRYTWPLVGCTGTLLFMYRYTFRNLPRLCIFSLFSILLIPNSILYFIYTSKPFHIHFVTSFLFNSSFNTYLYFKIYHELLSNNSNMGYDPYTNQIQGFFRVCSNPTLLPCN